MSIESTEDLFMAGLTHAYYAENRLLEALEQLAETSSHETLEEGFKEHHAETETQIERLEDVFESVDESPSEEQDPAVDGIIQAHEQFMDNDPSEEAINRYNIATGQMIEHYEIAAYGNLIPLADQLGLDSEADTLEKTLREEQDELETLSEYGEQFDYDELEA